MRAIFASAILAFASLAAAQTTTTVEVLKSGNVRSGPNIKASIFTTMAPGDKIDTFGPDETHPEWYVVTFPKSGRAWVHSKNLAATNDPTKWKVTNDKTIVRIDARITADPVAQLIKDEEIEFLGERVGDWMAIYPPRAVAYMHKTVLQLTAETKAKVDVVVKVEQKIDQSWEELQKEYEAFTAAFAKDPEGTKNQDWSNLIKQLEKVVDEHRDNHIRLTARKYANAIKRSVDRGQAPIAVVAVGPKEVTSSEGPKDVAPTIKPKVPEVSPELTEPSGYVKGWMEQRDDVGLGSTFLLLDKKGAEIAWLKTPAGSEINLSEFFWRRIGVKGEETTVENKGAKVRVITVKEILLLGR